MLASQKSPCVHAESPTHPLIRTEPNHQSARMTTCLPDMHATPRSTPTQITLRPARRAIRSASPTCVHSELICSTWKYCTPSRDPRHPICMPTRSARRADLHSDPICPPSRSALRPDLHADSRSSLREICSPTGARQSSASIRLDLHVEPSCTPSRSALRPDLLSYSDPTFCRPDLLSTRSAHDLHSLNASSATRAPCQRTPPSRSTPLGFSASLLTLRRRDARQPATPTRPNAANAHHGDVQAPEAKQSSDLKQRDDDRLMTVSLRRRWPPGCPAGIYPRQRSYR